MTIKRSEQIQTQINTALHKRDESPGEITTRAFGVENDDTGDVVFVPVGDRPSRVTIKRSEQIQTQINTARQMPSSAGAGTENDGDDEDDGPECKTAKAPAPAHPGAPAKLPGYGK